VKQRTQDVHRSEEAVTKETKSTKSVGDVAAEYAEGVTIPSLVY